MNKITPPSNKLSIAIDGQSASGKDTIGSLLAARLHCVFIESGSLYRAAAWKILQDQIDIDDVKHITASLKQTDFTITNSSDGCCVVFYIYVDGKDVTPFLRTKEIDLASSLLARQPQTRKILIALKKKMLRNFPRVIVTGRGIGRTVLPHADLKIYLTASLTARAERRWKQRKKNHPQVSLAEIKKEIRQRDAMNKNRTFDPDIPAEDSVIIDTSHLTIEKVCQRIERNLINRVRP